MRARPILPFLAPLVLLASARGLVDSATAGSPIDPFTHLPWTVTGPKSVANLGSAVAPAGDVNGDGYGDVLVGSPADSVALSQDGRVSLYYGSANGLSTSPAWSWSSGQFQAEAGLSLGPAGDVNGDGYGDIVLGLPLWNTPTADCGKAVVFHGGPAGPPASPNRTLNAPTSTTDEQYFGWVATTAGDVNGDGYADVLVTAPGFLDGSGFRRGAVYVYFGSASGVSATPSQTLLGRPQNGDFGQSASTAGDMNRDGYDEVVIGAPFEDAGFMDNGTIVIHRGTPSGLAAIRDTIFVGGAASCYLGTSVCAAGDINADGHADVIAGEPYAGWVGPVPQSGVIHRIYGGGAGLILTREIQVGDLYQANEHYGLGVATLGDLDGDGYADYGVLSEDGGANTRRIHVVLGNHDESLFFGSLRPNTGTQYSFGRSFSSSGDVDGDGRSEILVGDPAASSGGFSTNGRATLHAIPRRFPAPGILSPSTGPQPGTRFGQSLAIVNDFPNRGSNSLLVGDPQYDGIGRVTSHSPLPLRVFHLPDWIATGNANFQSYGQRVVDAGDMNRDGHRDVAISATTANEAFMAPGTPDAPMGISQQVGRVLLARGTQDGPSSPSLVLSGLRDFDRVGSALAGRGDVNRDGYHDLLVGAEQYDVGVNMDAGKAWVVYGGPGTIGQTTWSVEGESFGRGLGASVALGDLDADGYTDVILGVVAADGTPGAGRVQVHYGGPAGPATTPGLTLFGTGGSPSFGRTVCALGDVTGDGICDLGVGAPLENGTGRVYVFKGQKGRSQDPIPWWTKSGLLPGEQYGAAIAGGGDTDGDGIADFAIGAPFADGLFVDEGRVEFYQGGPLEPGPRTPTLQLGSGIVGAQFGASIAPLADINHDGIADLMIGAPGAAGRIYAWFGGGGSGFSSGMDMLDLIGETLFTRPAPNRLELATEAWPRVRLETPAGRTRMRIEYELRRQNEPFTGTPTHLDPTVYTTQVVTGNGTSETPLPIPAPGTAYKLRWRLLSTSPYIPRTPWRRDEARAMGEHDFWVSGQTVDAPADPVEHGALAIARVAPNPARAEGAGVLVEYALPRAADVTLDVHDVRGARVRRLVSGVSAAGPASVRWDGRDGSGRRMPAGVYFVSLRVTGGEEVRGRVVLLP